MENELPVCPCCMERHEPHIIRRREANIWKGVCVQYEAEYFWCVKADLFFADERMITNNHRAMIRAAMNNPCYAEQHCTKEQLKEMIPHEL